MGLLDKFSRDRDEGPDSDFFEEDIQPKTPPPPKEPLPQPDDPAYWERDESEWDHLKPRRKWLVIGWTVLSLILVALIVGFYLRYFSPYIDHAVEYGYIENVERKGTIFKTYEGVMIPYRELHDTTRVYSRDFVFSIKPEVAAELKKYELAHKPVCVEYVRYHATVPWRGSSKIVVVKVDSVDAKTILPPEFRPAIHQ